MSLVIIDDVEPIIINDEKVAEFKILVDDVYGTEKPTVAKKDTRTKRGLEKKVSQVLLPIP